MNICLCKGKGRERGEFGVLGCRVYIDGFMRFCFKEKVEFMYK